MLTLAAAGLPAGRSTNVEFFYKMASLRLQIVRGHGVPPPLDANGAFSQHLFRASDSAADTTAHFSMTLIVKGVTCSHQDLMTNPGEMHWVQRSEQSGCDCHFP